MTERIFLNKKNFTFTRVINIIFYLSKLFKNSFFCNDLTRPKDVNNFIRKVFYSLRLCKCLILIISGTYLDKFAWLFHPWTLCCASQIQIFYLYANIAFEFIIYTIFHLILISFRWYLRRILWFVPGSWEFLHFIWQWIEKN